MDVPLTNVTNRSSSKVIRLFRTAAKTTQTVQNRLRKASATVHGTHAFNNQNSASRYRSREHAATVLSWAYLPLWMPTFPWRLTRSAGSPSSSFLCLVLHFIDFLSFPFEHNASFASVHLLPVFSLSTKKWHRKQLTKKKGAWREHNFSFYLWSQQFCYSQYCLLLYFDDEEFGEREKRERETHRIFLPLLLYIAVRTHIKSKPRSLHTLLVCFSYVFSISMMVWSEGEYRKEVEGCREIGEISMIRESWLDREALESVTTHQISGENVLLLFSARVM